MAMQAHPFYVSLHGQQAGHRSSRAKQLRAHLVLTDGAANEQHDALPLVLVLRVLERELRDLHRGRQVGLALDLQALHRVEHAAQVRRRRLAGHGQHADRVLRVGLRLGAGQQVDRVGLRLEAAGRIVAVPRPLAVVHADHCGLHSVLCWTDSPHALL